MKRTIFRSITVLVVLLFLGCDGCGAPAPGDNVWPQGVDSIEGWLDVRGQPVDGPEDVDGLVDAMGERPLVLMGESTHGTQEFYEWRAEMSLALAEEHGVDFVGVEGDWSAARAADRFVMGQGDEDDVHRMLEDAFHRWGQHWMWSNEPFAEFLLEVRRFNEANPDRPIRIYGIDMQGFFESLDRLNERLGAKEGEEIDEIVDNLRCIGEFSPDPGRYARHLQAGDTEGCEEETTAAVRRIEEVFDGDETDELSLRRHARVIAAGERQHRKRLFGDPNDFWNVRVEYMAEAAESLLQAHGDDARGAIWAHNTHIGDARATDMADQGRTNIGHLAREQLGEDAVYAVGFSTYTGEVVAAANQGYPPQVMELPRADDGSVDEILARADESVFVLKFEEDDQRIPDWTRKPGQRAVGVTYAPQREVPGNYVPTNPAKRYEAVIFIEESTALDAFGGR